MSAWFDDGVGLYFAAHILAHAGLVTPDDSAKLVGHLLATEATSPYLGKSRLEIARAAETDPEAHAFMTAQGALYALRSAFMLRQVKAVHLLDPILIDLVTRARDVKDAMPEAAFTMTVAAEIGATDAMIFTEAIDQGHAVIVPEDALGPCFFRKSVRHARFTMGFDLERTLENPDRSIALLDPNGPAAKAGLQSTDLLVDVETKPDQPVRLTVTRSGVAQVILYQPKGKDFPGVTFLRKPGLQDTACGEVL